jgi:hypothetical protein
MDDFDSEGLSPPQAAVALALALPVLHTHVRIGIEHLDN